MANKEHLKLLKSGVETWNEWARSTWRVKDLSQADLRGINLERAAFNWTNLYQANLFRSHLRRAAFNSANLVKANLGETDLTQAECGWANFSQANLRKATLYQAVFNQANLSGANLSEADLSQVNLRNANLKGADLSRAKLYRADLRQADLSGAILDQANLTQTIYDERTIWPDGFVSPADALHSSPLDIKLRVSNLPPHITTDDLAEFFRPHGEIISVSIPADCQTKASERVGFIEMHQEEGEQAIRDLNGQTFKGSKLHIHQVARILTVDDDAEMRHLVELILTRTGYQPEFAGSGQQALQVMRTIPPDICLLDTFMPDMDGYEVYARMKADPRLCEIGVILLTGRCVHWDKEVTRYSIDNRDAYITKPFVISDMFKTIREVLGNYNKSHLAIMPPSF